MQDTDTPVLLTGSLLLGPRAVPAKTTRQKIRARGFDNVVNKNECEVQKKGETVKKLVTRLAWVSRQDSQGKMKRRATRMVLVSPSKYMGVMDNFRVQVVGWKRCCGVWSYALCD